MAEPAIIDMETEKARKPRSKAVAKVEEVQAVTVHQSMTPMEMLNAAIERGDSIDILERLMNLNERWEQGQARKAYFEAKAAFKKDAPVIFKDKENKQYKSMYSTIGSVVNPINEVLARHSLDASWSYAQTADSINVTCTLKHTLGHSESVTLGAPPDTSGNKNPIQQIKSTTTYLKLATFEAVTGIATKEGNKDDDGNGASDKDDPPITEKQLEELIDLAEAVGANRALFCKFYKIESFADIRASQFEAAKGALNAKRKAGA